MFVYLKEPPSLVLSVKRPFGEFSKAKSPEIFEKPSSEILVGS
jgi:hypothetical protein